LRARCASGSTAKPTLNARVLAMRWSCAAANSNAARSVAQVRLTDAGTRPFARRPSRHLFNSVTLSKATGLLNNASVKWVRARFAL
jgi:hypothetical protein